MIKAGDPKRGPRSKKFNRIVTLPASPYCELAQWVMDMASFPYEIKPIAPIFHVLMDRSHSGSKEIPVLITSEATLSNMRQALEYVDARLPADKRLFSEAIQQNPEAERLLNLVFNDFGVAITRFVYSYLLPERKIILPILTNGLSLWQRLIVKTGYPIIKTKLQRWLPASPSIAVNSRNEIEAIFNEINSILADGRPYLLGDTLSIADISFAALAAPLLIPEEYNSPLPSIEELPEKFREFSLALRDTSAGNFILRLYRDHRPFYFETPAHHPTSTSPENTLRYYKNRVIAAIIGASAQRLAFGLLRRFKPVLALKKTVIVTRDKDVRDALARDTDFTISEINAPNMQRLNGDFFLGMDRSEEYTQEHGALHKAIHADDDRFIGEIVRRHCDDLIRAALPVGRIDMVSNFSRLVATRFIADYFGVPGPDETTMMHWMRALFHDLFLNLNNDKNTQITAENSYSELRAYLLDLIDERKQQVKNGNSGKDFLSRLVSMQLNGEITLDDDGIRRNLSGLIVGALDTTSKTSTLIVEQLLKKPAALKLVRDAENHDTLARLCFEILRFDTMAPVMRRYCRNGSKISGANIPADSNVYLATASAMFDERAWPDPYKILSNRPLDQYLHFGDGMHRCFGEYINRIQIPIIVSSLVGLRNIRKIGPVLYDGPFPDQFLLAFDN